MPVTHTIDTQRQIARSVFRGDLDDVAIRDRVRKLRADPRFHDRMPELVDLSAVTGIAITVDMMKVSARSLLHESGIRCAIVAPSDPVFDFARAYQALRERNGIEGLRVVRTVEEAMVWLETDIPRIVEMSEAG